jgi:hypothetical protein
MMTPKPDWPRRADQDFNTFGFVKQADYLACHAFAFVLS